MSRWLYNYRSARMPGRTPLRDAHVWQFKCWLSALIRKPPDKRAKITVIWHVWYAYMYIPHIFPCRDWSNLCDGRKQAWPDCVPHKKNLWKVSRVDICSKIPGWKGFLCRTYKFTSLYKVFSISWDLRLHMLSSDSSKCTVNLTHAALSSVFELIKLAAVLLLNYLQQTHFITFLVI